MLIYLLLISGVLALFIRFALPRLFEKMIRARLAGYRVIRETGEGDLPQRIEHSRSVAVLGAGVAGLTAALTLARRGYQVTIYEKNEFLGGKLGSCERPIGGGQTAWVSHGFHAFFPHYHNLNRVLDSLGIRRQFRAIDDYLILARDGSAVSFADVAKTPVLNLLSLLNKGLFTLGEALRAPGRDVYGVFLEYDQARTFAEYDGLSYGEFSRRAQIPASLKLAFNTFARAFFAEEDRLSLAELIKSFHFYYLSHDGGLLYDYPICDYESGILEPFRLALTELGVRLELGHEVTQLAHDQGKFELNGQSFDAVVVALDPLGLGRVFSQARGLPEAVRGSLAAVRAGQRYAVWRVWLSEDVRAGLPVFSITERKEILDSVTLYHRFERETQAQLQDETAFAEVKSVLELHSYSIPDDVLDSEIPSKFWSELVAYFPELAAARICFETLNVAADFTAFHCNLDATRPTVPTGLRGLYCAGDWVKLDFPAMLLEAAASSGLLAANGILAEDGLLPERIECVPERGLLAGMKAPQGRAVLGMKVHQK